MKKLIWILMLIILCSFVSSSITDYNSVTQGYFTFEPNNPYLNDVPAGNDFIWVNTPSATTGIIDNGTNIDEGSSDAIYLSTQRDLSHWMNFWYYQNDANGIFFNGWDKIKSWAVGNVDFYSSLDEGTSVTYFYGAGCGSWTSIPFGAGAFKENTWQMITWMIDDSDNRFIVWSNATVVINTTIPGQPCLDENIVMFGLQTAGYVGGLIDEMIVANGTITQTDVEGFFNEGAPNSNQQYPYSEPPSNPPNITDINCSGQTSTPFGTNDTTPTCTWTTDIAGTCGMSNINGSYNEASTTGTTSHIGTINTTQELGLGTRYVYINCTANDLSAIFKYEMYIGSCACKTSGIWNINCYDKCTISDSCAMDGSDFIINQSTTGTYSLFIENNITGYGDVLIKGYDSSNKCNVICESGGCIN